MKTIGSERLPIEVFSKFSLKATKTYFLGGLPPRPLPDGFPVLEGQPAPRGLIGGCPLCFDMSITSLEFGLFTLILE